MLSSKNWRSNNFILILFARLFSTFYLFEAFKKKILGLILIFILNERKLNIYLSIFPRYSVRRFYQYNEDDVFV